MFLLLSYFGFLVGVPGEGNGIVGNLLNVANGVEALLVVSCNTQKNKNLMTNFVAEWSAVRNTQEHFISIHFQSLYDTRGFTGCSIHPQPTQTNCHNQTTQYFLSVTSKLKAATCADTWGLIWPLHDKNQDEWLNLWNHHHLCSSSVPDIKLEFMWFIAALLLCHLFFF